MPELLLRGVAPDATQNWKAGGDGLIDRLQIAALEVGKRPFPSGGEVDEVSLDVALGAEREVDEGLFAPHPSGQRSEQADSLENLMPFDETLANRIRERMKGRSGIAERKMFGGLAFLLRGHMCCGVVGSDLVVRVGPDAYERLLREPCARPIDFTARPLKGMVYVSLSGDWTPGDR